VSFPTTKQRLDDRFGYCVRKLFGIHGTCTAVLAKGGTVTVITTDELSSNGEEVSTRSSPIDRLVVAVTPLLFH
jgi:hypothetical protein